MPILQHSQAHLPPVPAPPYDSKRKHKEVWYLRSTNEIFTDYEYVIEKDSLVHQLFCHSLTFQLELILNA
jgi:hypothetical protein